MFRIILSSIFSLMFISIGAQVRLETSVESSYFFDYNLQKKALGNQAFLIGVRSSNGISSVSFSLGIALTKAHITYSTEITGGEQSWCNSSWYTRNDFELNQNLFSIPLRITFTPLLAEKAVQISPYLGVNIVFDKNIIADVHTFVDYWSVDCPVDSLDNSEKTIITSLASEHKNGRDQSVFVNFGIRTSYNLNFNQHRFGLGMSVSAYSRFYIRSDWRKRGKLLYLKAFISYSIGKKSTNQSSPQVFNSPDF
jgi:hypothetical protein